MPASLDHLVFGALDLETSAAWLEERLGVPLAPGGKHEAMGTHNRLLRLGPRSYLELIAIDPSGKKPSRPRWFGLDEPAISARLATPCLLTWAAAIKGLSSPTFCAGFETGEVHAMSRGGLNWLITIPAAGSLLEGGALPALIEWPEGTHPAAGLPGLGVSLELLELRVASPERMTAALKLLGLDIAESRVLVTGNASGPAIRACLNTPRGPVWFDGAGAFGERAGAS